MALINIIITLMISAKIATPSFKKGYDVIISVHDVTKDILSCDSNYIVDVSCEKRLVTQAFLWEKLS